MAGALLLPFGWVLPLARLAWVHVSMRRGEGPAPDVVRDSHADPTADTQ